MAETSKLPVKTQKVSAAPLETWRPFESLRREIDRLFDDFGGGRWPRLSSRSLFDIVPRSGEAWAAPAVDFVETEASYEVTAELPGMDEKNIEVKFADGVLTIKGEKQEEKEQKKKDYYLQERKFGSFERSFRIPETVDTDKIAAGFKNGMLTVTLPKKLEAQKPAKNIEVKAA
jgi:HSP20 family protein